MKNNSLKLLFFTVFLGVLAVFGYKALNTYKKADYQEDITSQIQTANMDIRDFYLARFEQKEQELNQELEKALDIDACKQHQKQLSADFKEYANSKKNTPAVIKSTTQNLIETIAQDFGIKPSEFIIVQDTMGPSPAAVEECIFYVNEKLLTSYSPKAQKFIIAHEFSHMVHHDGAFLTAISHQLNLNEQTDQNLFDKVSRFQEARADVFASTKNAEYAEGGLEFFNELYDRHGDQSGISHPKNSERITAHKTIVGIFNDQPTIA